MNPSAWVTIHDYRTGGPRRSSPGGRTSPGPRGRALAAAALLLAAAPAALAQDAGESGVPACDGGKTAMRVVDDMMQAWKVENPTVRSLRQRNVSVIEGLAEIGVHVDHSDWGKARALAYTRAYLDAMGAFVRQTNEEITTETVRDLLQDATSIAFEAGENPATYLERVAKKEEVLLELKLDQELKAAGMSDDDLARLSVREKIPQYRDSLARETTSLAFGRASGLVPLKTFEAVCDGNSYLGVIAVFSTRMRDLAQRIQDGDAIRPDPDRGGVSLGDRIGALSDEDLVTEFGVRRWWDEDGYPVIVSFGQWGWSTKALSAAQRDRRYRFARDQAAIQARSYLAEFVTVNAQFTETSFMGDVIEDAVEVGADGFTSNVAGANFADRIVREARTRSTVQLTGLDILRTWSARHPVAEHQELTGAVAYWSPAREDAVRASLGLEAKHPAPEPEPASAPEAESRPTASGTAQSKDLMDASDF